MTTYTPGALRKFRKWNRMHVQARYEYLRQWYPDCWAVNSMATKTWEQLPAQFRFIIRTNPR